MEDCRQSFTMLTKDKVTREAAEAKAQDSRVASQADDLIDFVQLKARKGLSQIEIEDQVTTGEGRNPETNIASLFRAIKIIVPLYSFCVDLHRATGMDVGSGDSRRLNRVLQLTGFSDPVYAEANITVHQYDVVMDVTVSHVLAGLQNSI
jgi:coatomer subunit beta